jgi:hypothetical protein
MAPTSTALAAPIPPGGFLALNHEPDQVQAVVQANFGGQEISPFDLPRVKIPGSGGRTWEMPTIEGTIPLKEISGIVVHFKLVRGYWPGEFKGSEPPQCSSDDNRVGVGDPGGECASCPLAQFGTDKAGRGQACKQMEQWFLLTPDQLLPIVLSLPPQSLAPAKKYRLNLASAMLRLDQVVTTLTLDTDTNPDGVKYAFAVPTLSGRLDPGEAAKALEYTSMLRPILERMPAVNDVDQPRDTVEATS